MWVVYIYSYVKKVSGFSNLNKSACGMIFSRLFVRKLAALSLNSKLNLSIDQFVDIIFSFVDINISQGAKSGEYGGWSHVCILMESETCSF